MAKTKKTPELCDAICEWIANGGTLRQFCRDNNLGWTTVYQWMKDDAVFAERIARARDLGCDAIAEEIIEISDDSSGDTIETEKGPIFNKEFALRSKIRIDARLKLLAKWYPKKYGESTTLKGDPDAPLRLVQIVDDIRE